MPLLPSPMQQIFDPLFEEKGLQVYVKREDLIHPVIMGNKWRKLKYNLERARHLGFTSLTTMGGAFSNHVLATAAAAHENGLFSRAVIRGEELNASSNVTLKTAASYGMQFEFVSRHDYRTIRENFPSLREQYPNTYILPEGGTNALAIRGCEELVEEIKIDFNYICCPIGTGGTLAGITKALSPSQVAIGVSALKGDFVNDMMQEILTNNQIINRKLEVFNEYHFGGYAKTSDELINFILDFKAKHEILLDPIYTGKLFYAVIDLIKRDFFKFNHKIILVHTGGIQGIQGYNVINRRKIS